MPLHRYGTAALTDRNRALNSDVLLLNEIGLDPGIDHCSAISLLQSLLSQNKRVVSFASFCGGVPAPESAEGVPLGYKFSWSPRGVLSAALNGSRFKLGGKVMVVN
jgi:alpha-aminoadipic semialdehyde synthase